MLRNYFLGKEGERIACDFLEQKGYSIKEKNFRYKRAEVDIIAQKDNVLVFVEVKLRTSVRFGEPEEFVTKRKIMQLKQAAEHYVSLLTEKVFFRFDIISILKKKNTYQIEHLEDVFL
ncbi:MAG: YraN family protein [Cytophagales bacterium]|nr:YraN family protein [Cytophagales bacterium]MDW8384401.1 YraN family protein [Flammeovirgaceae bacterium]